MPLRSSRLLPVASTSAVNWEPAVLILRSIAARSVIISDASRRRVRPTTSRGSDRGQQGACLGRGQELLRPTRQEFQQESVQPVHGVGARGAELVPAIHQQPKRDQVVVGGDLPQRRGAQRDNGDGVRIGGVGLAALPGGEHPGSRRQLRGNVHDRLPIGDQALRDVLADAVAPFDRPDPIGPSSRTSIVADRLCGSIPIATRLIRLRSPSLSTPLRTTRRAALLRAGQTPVEPHLATVPGEDPRHERATPISGGQPM